MSRRRVVITGLGCVSPVGNTVEQAWTNLLAGRSGIDLITKFDASTFSCKIAGEVKNFDLESYISAKEARTMDTFIHYGIAAAAQAVVDSGLPTGDALNEELATRIGCVIGSGIGGLEVPIGPVRDFVGVAQVQDRANSEFVAEAGAVHVGHQLKRAGSVDHALAQAATPYPVRPQRAEVVHPIKFAIHVRTPVPPFPWLLAWQWYPRKDSNLRPRD